MEWHYSWDAWVCMKEVRIVGVLLHLEMYLVPSIFHQFISKYFGQMWIFV